MDLNDLKNLNKEMGEQTEEMNRQFVGLFKKFYDNYNKRVVIVNMVHLPLNIIINMISQDETNSMCQIFPELPDMFMRFMLPFSKMKNLWGQIPNEKWAKLAKEYGRLYGAQFDGWFVNAESKERFKEWFEAEKKNGGA